MARKRAGRKKTAGTRKKAKTTRPKKPAAAPVSIDALGPNDRASVFREIDQILQNRGVRGSVAALHLTADDVLGIGCPPGQVRRMVCKKQAGTVVCAAQCTDV